MSLVLGLALSVPSPSVLRAEPGDTTWAFSSLDSGLFPPYSTVLFFADTITGSATGTGTQSSAYRFTATASGPMEYLQVILYAPVVGPASSVNVSVYNDAGGQLGARIASFAINTLTAGGFRGYFAYHNYGDLEPNETAILISKGKSYWVAVEPRDPNTLVYWAQSQSTQTTRKYRFAGGTGSYPNTTRNTPAGVTLAVFEPYPPEVASAGTPLVEKEQVPGEPTGTVLNSLGKVPQTPALGSLKTGNRITPALLGATGSVMLRVGDPAPGLASTSIVKLGEPTGDLVLATLRRQSTPTVVTAANEVVLIGGLRTPPLRVMARSGEAIAGGNGAVIRQFLSLDGGGTDAFFTVQLSGAGVTSRNQTALAAAPGSDPARLLVRQGDSLQGSTVSVISTLAVLPQSSGEGRWRASDNAIGVLLTLANGTRQLFTLPANATSSANWTAWAATKAPLPAPLENAVIKTLGVPGFGPDGVVFTATLQTGVAGVTSATDSVLLRQTASGLQVLAREGDLAPDKDGAPLPDVKFRSFGHPVHGPAGKVAFLGTVAARSNTTGLWWLDGNGMVRLIVRAGDPAPQLGTFSKFLNVVFPNGSNGAPILKARLLAQSNANVASSQTDGIWALNSAGQLTFLARNGSFVFLNSNLQGRLSGLTSFVAATGSAGAEHGIDANGAVRVHATIANTSPAGSKRAQFPIPIPAP